MFFIFNNNMIFFLLGLVIATIFWLFIDYITDYFKRLKLTFMPVPPVYIEKKTKLFPEHKTKLLALAVTITNTCESDDNNFIKNIKRTLELLKISDIELSLLLSVSPRSIERWKKRKAIPYPASRKIIYKKIISHIKEKILHHNQ